MSLSAQQQILLGTPWALKGVLRLGLRRVQGRSEVGYDASRASFKCNSGERRTKGQRTRCRVADCAHSAVGVDVGVATLAARAFVAATQTWNMTGAEQERGSGKERGGKGAMQSIVK